MSSKNGATVKDVPTREFVTALSVHFKKSGKLELPAWHDIVKTSTARELAPQDPDWYYVRAASVARKIYLRGGTGVGDLSRIYGSQKRHGVAPQHFQRAARGLHRHILKQLQELDLVAKKKDKTGRWITKNGQHELDTIAGQVLAATKPAAVAASE